MTLTFVTGNANKLAEVQQIVSFPLLSISLDLVEIQGTPSEITLAKARSACEIVGGPVIVEDTCLCFHAMGGLPGSFLNII